MKFSDKYSCRNCKYGYRKKGMYRQEKCCEENEKHVCKKLYCKYGYKKKGIYKREKCCKVNEKGCKKF
jgi:hypothetical protein